MDDPFKRPLKQTDESWQRGLVELRARAERDVRLDYEDSEQIGNKYTECNLGLCDREIERAMDGIYRDSGHGCPNDGRFFDRLGNQIVKPDGADWGCFFKCHVFNGGKKGKAATRGRVLNACKTLIVEEPKP